MALTVTMEKKDLEQHLRVALQSLDDVMKGKGKLPLAKVSESFSDAIRCVVYLRNHIAHSDRSDAGLPDMLSLDRVNTLISLVASIEYPLAGIQWLHIPQVKEGLQDMLNSK